MPISEGLLAAYKAARYVVYADQEPVFFIGEHCPELDELLEAENAECAAFLTAFNPHGLRAHDDTNWGATARLMEAFDSLDYEIYIGESNDPEGEWPHEPSFLILGIPRAEAAALGRRFGQLAIVYAEKGRAPELVVLA